MRPIHTVILSALLGTAAAVAYAQVALNSVRQVTIGTGGAAPAGTSGSPVFSANGKFLAFRSDASNLIALDQNGVDDVFVADLTANTLSRQSVSAAGAEGDGPSTNPSITAVGADGFYAVAFETLATNLTSDLSTFGRQIAVRFPTRNITEFVSLAAGGSPGNGDSRAPSVTLEPATNRTLVVFSSEASDLVENDDNSESDIFLVTVTQPPVGATSLDGLATTTRISVVPGSAVEANGDNSEPVLSGDGRYVAFSTRATNLVPGVTGAGQQIVLFDRQTSTMSYVSRSADGIVGNGDSSQPAISYSGRFIAYRTLATNIIGDAVDGIQALVVYDRQTNTSRRINRTAEGVAGNGDGATPGISPNGRFVVFSDLSDNLIANDTNGDEDVFLKDFETGAITRISVASNGVEGNADSDIPVAVLTGFNSLVSRIGFRSFADNLTDSPTIGGGEIVLSEGSLPAPTLNRGELLEAPPDVTVQRRRTRVQMQKFGATALAVESLPLTAAATARRVQYDVRIQNVQKKRNRVRLITRRNTVTSKKLKPGTYTVQYRAQITSGSKTVASSSFSPRIRVTIPS